MRNRFQGSEARGQRSARHSYLNYLAPERGRGQRRLSAQRLGVVGEGECRRVSTVIKAVSLILSIFAVTPAHADSSCWQAGELKAYDITMETLLLAHESADCEAPGASTLRGEFATFLGRFEPQLDADRTALAQYFQRAYGDDWETPLNKMMSREGDRVGKQVKQMQSPQFCDGAAAALGKLGGYAWDDFVGLAQTQEWHEKAEFPACP
jgi:hypothetical protein